VHLLLRRQDVRARCDVFRFLIFYVTVLCCGMVWKGLETRSVWRVWRFQLLLFLSTAEGIVIAKCVFLPISYNRNFAEDPIKENMVRELTRQKGLL